MRNTIAAWWRKGWESELEAGEERLRFCLCLLFTLFWGLIAHAYGFLHDSFSHDVLNALVADGVETYWKMQLGRFFAVIYRRTIRGVITMPWLIGLLSLVWIALAVYLCARLLHLRSRPTLFLTAGIFTVNLTVTALTATYLYELDIDMTAMLAAVAAVFLWARFGWAGTILGAFCVTGSLGLYQSYLCVTVSLVMLSCILSLLEGEGFKPVFLRGLRAVGMVLAGGGIYYLLLQLMARLKDIPLNTGSYNSVYKVLDPDSVQPGFFQRVGDVYRDWAASFFDPAAAHVSPGMRLANLALALLILAALIAALLNKKLRPADKALLLTLTALLPFGMNATRFLSGQDVHELMKYAFWLVYLLALLLGRFLAERAGRPGKAARVLAGLLVLGLLWNGTQTANIIYVKKDLEQDATLSLMTRVLGRLEEREDYVPGETELAFIGVSDQINPSIYGFEEYGDMMGLGSASAIPTANAEYYYNAYGAFFRYVLNNPAKMCDWRSWDALQTDERTEDMPPYPDPDCIRMIDGILVIKMGGQFEW